jgi:hypothetical protein
MSIIGREHIGERVADHRPAGIAVGELHRVRDFLVVLFRECRDASPILHLDGKSDADRRDHQTDGKYLAAPWLSRR